MTFDKMALLFVAGLLSLFLFPTVATAQPISENTEQVCSAGSCYLKLYSDDAFVYSGGQWKDITDVIGLTIDADFNVVVTDSAFGNGIIFKSVFKKGTTETEYSDFTAKGSVDLIKTQSDYGSVHKFGFYYTKTSDFDEFVWQTSDPVTIDDVSKKVTRGRTEVGFHDLVENGFTVDISQKAGVTSVVVGNLTGRSFLDPTVTLGNEAGGQELSNMTDVKQNDAANSQWTAETLGNGRIRTGYDSAGDTLRAYIKFNFTGLVPGGTIISNATVYLTEDDGTASATMNIGIYNVTAQSAVNTFDEQAYNWNGQACGTSNSFNSSCNSTALDTVSVTDNQGTYGFNVLAAVQTVANNTNAVFFALNGSSGGQTKFEAKTSSVAVGLRPYLSITYSSSNNSLYFTASSINAQNFQFGDTLIANVTVTNGTVNSSVGNVYAEIFGANQTMFKYAADPAVGGNGGVYSYNATLSSQSNGTYTIRFFATDAPISLNGTDSIRNVNFVYITPVIAACNATFGTYAVTMSFFHEANRSQIIAPNNVSLDMTVNISVGNQNYTSSVGFRNSTSYSICIYPSYATYVVNSVMQYYASPFSSRTYYLNNATISNASQNVSLFLLPNADSSLVSFTIRDASGVPQGDAYISILRYYPDFNQYSTVEIVKTDPQGISPAYIVLNNVFYKFLVTKNNLLTFTGTAALITTTSISINIGGSTQSEYYTYLGGIARSCTLNNSTRTISCTWSDTTGFLTNGCLLLEKQTALRTTILNDTCTTSSSGSIGLTIPNTNDTYSYTFYGKIVHSPEKKFFFQSGTLNPVQTAPFGVEGLFISFFVLISMIGVGLRDPRVAMIMGMFALVVTVILGVFAVSVAAVASLIIVGIIVLWRSRQG